jgi:hypothetical protein
MIRARTVTIISTMPLAVSLRMNSWIGLRTWASRVSVQWEAGVTFVRAIRARFHSRIQQRQEPWQQELGRHRPRFIFGDVMYTLPILYGRLY